MKKSQQHTKFCCITLLFLFSIQTYAQDTTYQKVINYVYDTTAVNHPLSISFSSGIQFIKRNYNSTNLSSSSIIQSKEKGETLKSNMILKIGLEYEHNSWSIASGIYFNSIHENVNYIIEDTLIEGSYNTNITDDSFYQYHIIDTFYQISGTDTNTIVLKDSTFIEQIDTSYSSRYTNPNQYQYVEMPLIIKKDIFWLKNFRMQIGSGPIIGLLTRSSGYSLSPTPPHRLINNNRKQYSSWLFYWKAQIDFSYIVNDYFDIFLSVNYRYLLNNFNKDARHMKIKNQNLVIDLGIKYFI